MPKKNGLQVLNEVRQLYAAYNKSCPAQPLLEPEFIFLTAYSSKGFQDYLKDKRVRQVYEKPLHDS